MGAERTDVGETAEGICGDETGAGGKVGVLRVLLEGGVGDEFVLFRSVRVGLSGRVKRELEWQGGIGVEGKKEDLRQ